MGNLITFDRRPDLPSLKMSNGASDVFWDTLRLASEDPAPPDGPLGWLLARAPTAEWYGASGFDLDEMPWGAVEPWAIQRAALLRAVDLATSGEGWERLGYSPDPDRARASLAAFRVLVAEYEPLPTAGDDERR